MPFLKHNNITLHYQVYGTGAPLLIIGGLGDNTRNWLPLASALGKYYKVITFDNRAAGQSTHPQEDFTINNMAGDVIALIAHLALHNVSLMGFSMGGKVAMQLAITKPEFINNLILISTGPGLNNPDFIPSKEAREILKNPQNTPEHYARQYSILFSKEHQKKFPAQGFVKFKQIDPHPQPVASFLKQLKAMAACDISPDVHKISCPTLVFAGSDDPITPVVNAQWLNQNIKNSKLIIYPNAGHVLQGERSQEFVSEIVRFIAR